MGEIVEGLDPGARERIAALRASGRFFWVDVSLPETSADELASALDIPEHALAALLRFRDDAAPSRKFHADDQHVVFAFTCFLGADRAIEVHVLVCGDFLLTLHRERVSLRKLLTPEPPEGRSDQYVVYAILDAMVVTAFDALNETELTLENLELMSTDLRAARPRMATVRTFNSRLSTMRRRIGPQRGIFERVSEEIGHVKGLEGDSERYFERVGDQLNRLVDAIDAAASGTAQLLDLRLNETIYWLTVVSTIFLPLTFVTGFFGMNFGWMVREITTELDFFLFGVGGCAAGVAVTLWLVRRRGTPVESDPMTRG
jgi:magnesium transporter